MILRKKPKDSWQKVGKWYGKITKGEGHYYHKNIIIPRVLKLLNLKNKSKVLDLGCGSGVFGRSIDKNIKYLGIDLSHSLIKEAIKQDRSSNHSYLIGDASNLNVNEYNFTDAVFILSLQNMKYAEQSIKNATSKLSLGGKLLVVLNHPAFRIPKQSSWQVDANNKTQYRRINKYMSKMSIPINMNPSDKNSEFTWSYHYSISEIVEMFVKNGLLISKIEEWCSDKISTGPASKMENVARQEFPLFMTIVGVKV